MWVFQTCISPGRTESPIALPVFKAAFDIYAPVSGTVSRVNEAVSKSPQIVNHDCYGAGWLFAITPTASDELSSLLSSDAYAKQIDAAPH